MLCSPYGDMVPAPDTQGYEDMQRALEDVSTFHFLRCGLFSIGQDLAMFLLGKEQGQAAFDGMLQQLCRI